MTPGNTVSVSSGLVVVDLRRAKILFLIEFLTGNLVLTLGEEESTEETVVDLAKPGLLGSSPGRRPNNGLRVEGETGAGVSVANSDRVSAPPLFTVLNSIIVVCPGSLLADMPVASGLSD